MIRAALAWAIGPALPWVAGGLLVALVGGAFTIDHRGHARGKAACEAAHADAQKKTAAATIASEGRVERTYVEKVREVYRDRPDPVCIDAGGLRLIQEADRAAGDPGAAGIRLDAVRAADAGGQPSRK